VLLVGAILLAVFVLSPPWGVVAVGAAAVIEIGEFFFWMWLSRRRRPQAGAEALFGVRAEVVAACRPVGSVRVQGELWRARCDEGADPGERVRVAGLEGLTLVVERDD
jgi:membrane protein implicated in regulation of membrane protease activity